MTSLTPYIPISMNRRRKTTYWFAALILATFLASCVSTKTPYRISETSLATTSFDGRCEIRVQGRGVSPYDAYKNACQKAVHEVLFKNTIRAQGENSNVAAIIDDSTIEHIHESYFQHFFSNGGTYERFLIGNRFLGKRKAHKDIERNKIYYTYAATFVVDRGALKEYMRSEGFLK